MAGSFQVHVFDKQQSVYRETFTGEVELGRQRDGKEKLYLTRREGEKARVAIARIDEDTVSRDHARIEPLPENRARVTNISAKVSIRLADGSELKAGSSTEVDLPAVIYLGRKAVRLQPPDVKEAPLRGLAEQTAPPMTIGGGGGMVRFPTLDGIKSIINPGPAVAPSINLQAQMEEVIRWLQQTMEVLHLAASSSDFMQKAAQATVDIVGLDRGRVLLLEGEEWKPVATYSSPKFSAKNSDWKASNQVLAKVREEKRTFWQAPDEANLEDSESLVGVEVIVASPILNPQGDVIGAIYGDVHQESFTPTMPKITRLEAIIIELLGRGVAVGLARMEQERAAIAARIQFEQFFTRELSQQLSLNPDLLEGRDAEVSLLFCDIRGFSRISERLGPEGTVRWVGQVMGTLSDSVLNHQGVLVDYIGDELLAMWGAPVEQPNHAERACRAALDMLGSLPAMNERWEPILGEPLHIGIGINTGVARVGNTGSKHKFKYGPLGNTVNLASRVQGATKYLKCTLLVTENTEAKLGAAFKKRKLCSVRVINIKKPVALFELYPDNQAYWPDLQTKYEMALKEFEESQFRPASRTLANLLGEVPDDGPALVLLSRAVNAAVNGPDDHHPVWDLPREMTGFFRDGFMDDLLFDLCLTDPRHPLHVAHMEMALDEAEQAAAEDEVPVGAVIVVPERGVIARAHNQREQLQDPTAHAEMIAITQAAHSLQSWRLEQALLYVTLEPCPMCAGAIVQARIPFVVYGCTDPKAGACHTLFQIPSDARLNHRAQVVGGVLSERCSALLTRFFAAKRLLGKK